MTTWSRSAIWCTREANHAVAKELVVIDDGAHAHVDRGRRSRARRSSSRCSKSMPSTASTALGNSTSTASPATSMQVPPKALMLGSISSRCTNFHADTAAASSRSIRRVQPTTSAKAIAAHTAHHAAEVSKPDSRIRDTAEISRVCADSIVANIRKLGDIPPRCRRRAQTMEAHAPLPCCCCWPACSPAITWPRAWPSTMAWTRPPRWRCAAWSRPRWWRASSRCTACRCACLRGTAR